MRRVFEIPNDWTMTKFAFELAALVRIASRLNCQVRAADALAKLREWDVTAKCKDLNLSASDANKHSTMEAAR